ncbi:MAG: GntR family transcriptional regulator [Bacteroidia bacterium]|nr:GntR family transcriptional regulator [Bacteroidia bacterium]
MTALPGQYNELLMLKSTDFGIYLDGGDLGEILMPLKYVPEGVEAGQRVHCFVYYDTEDRLIATTEIPKAVVGECAFLECVAATKFGAFMHWGLTKDLLVPHREQNLPLEEGRSYVIHIYTDTVSNRIVGSAKIEKHLNKTTPTFKEGDEVNLLIARKTDSGMVAVINHTHTGLIYQNEIFQNLRSGDAVKGYIFKMREDGKTDLKLQKPGYDALVGLDKDVVNVFKKHGGYLAVTDKSDPEEIYRLFQMSKKNWKKIIGNLYKKRAIEMFDEGIRIVQHEDD